MPVLALWWSEADKIDHGGKRKAVATRQNSRSQMSADSYRVSSRRMHDRQLRERTIRHIQNAVAEMFGLSIEELGTEGRSRDVAFPRQMAMYLAKQLTDASLSEIGQEFGGKHHTTVTHSIARIHQLRATDAGVNNAIRNLLEKLQQP